ncbi:unnamed protein product [Arabis nemorensis]|uniref:Multiple C2 domain-containing protein n=1 Tax=Arabis nemorensis TaxID=586526 RepID=A0A565BX92_9BRAS|nr:unnamed protein product [Arabis nemorensis]
MLKPKNRNSVSMRRSKANCKSLYRMVQTLSMWGAWFDANIRLTTDVMPKLVAVYIFGLLLLFPKWILLLAVYGVLLAFNFLRETSKYYKNIMYGIDTPPLVPDENLKLEELESFQSSMAEKVVAFVGKAASWGEKLCVLFTVRDDPLGSIYLLIVCYMILFVICSVSYQILGMFLMVYLVNFPFMCCDDLPTGIINFFTRLPTKAEDIG